VFVYADVSVGVGAFVCVCKIQLQDPSQSIASVERPAGAKHILQPDKHPRTTKTAAAEAHQHLPPHEVGEFHIDVGEWILGGRMA